MSDIFLSYAHEDQARIQQLAQALEGQGWTVFWDRTLSAGSTWRETIGKALETAGCVVVAWSKHSIASHWVCEEAEEGQERNILVPVFFDNVKPPLGFRSIHAANLALWDGSTDAEAFRHLVSSIMRVIGPPKASPEPPPPVLESEADRQAELKKAMAQAESDRRLAEEHAAVAKAQRLAAEQVNEQNRKNTKPPATLHKPFNSLRPYAWLVLALAFVVLAGEWLFNANKPSERVAPIQHQEDVNAKEVAEAKRQADDQARVADAKRAKAEAESKRLAEENAKVAEAQRLAAAQANAEQEAKAKAEAQRKAAEATKPLSVFQDTLKDGTLGPKMVWMPTGQFRMGDLTGKGVKEELPVHTVTITKPFAMGQYEVTFAEYDQFAQATHLTLPNDEGWGRGRRPVINVSWEDAGAYAKWLSAQTGKHYRLPTAAEWEYAARAGTETDYWWGNAVDKNRANCDGCGSQWDNQQTAPVGSFQPNPWGLYDTAGNVWEWVQDCRNVNYDAAPDDGSAWQTGECGLRGIRSGSWSDRLADVRSANRWRFNPDNRSDGLGFRLAQDD